MKNKLIGSKGQVGISMEAKGSRLNHNSINPAIMGTRMRSLIMKTKRKKKRPIFNMQSTSG